MENKINYESILWIYPNRYGLRIRDGKWITIENKPEEITYFNSLICIEESELDTENLIPGNIYYTMDTNRFIFVSTEPLHIPIIFKKKIIPLTSFDQPQ